jgi:transmembrane sensor
MRLLPRWLAQSPSGDRWFARIRSGRMAAREDRAFLAWLDAGEANARELENNDLAWGLTLELQDRAPIARLIEDTLRGLEPQAAARRAPARRPRFVIAATTALLLVALGAALLWLNGSSESDYRTAVGEQRVVKLEDGSTVTLNTASRVHIRYSHFERRIELTGGDILLAVHPDAARPFVVVALDDVTTAVGTEFAVETRGTGASVSVLEGTVTVGPLSAAAGAAVRVTAGQAVDYEAGAVPGEPRAADSARIRAWQSNHILFADKRLADAIQEFNRYSTVPIVLDAPALADRRVDGLFRVGDQNAFIHALERALPLRAKRDPNTVTLVPK